MIMNLNRNYYNVSSFQNNKMLIYNDQHKMRKMLELFITFSNHKLGSKLGPVDDDIWITIGILSS